MEEQAADDTGLLRAIASGDHQAFASLVDRHIALAHARARSLLGSPDGADDVVQDVFLKIWRDPALWQPGTAQFSTWLYRVVSNACIDRLRRSGRETGTDDVPERADPAPMPDASLIAGERAARVHNAIDTLGERQRQAIRLVHIEGFSNIETAEIMATTVEAIESLLGRARRKLKTLLAEDIREMLDQEH